MPLYNAEPIKRFVSRAGHGRSFLRRLPPDLGGCYFPASLEGGAKFLKPDLHRADEVLTRFAQDYVQPGSRVWDIGANVGLFTFTAAGLAGPQGEVVALEADSWLVGNLRKAATANTGRGAPVAVLPVAASDSFGVAEFNIAKTARATNFLTIGGGSTTTGGVREKQLVPTMPLDALLARFAAPRVLKIDVEGAEEFVLRGAGAVLRSRPTLLLEVLPAHSRAIHALLEPLSYSYIDAITRAVVELPTFNVIATRSR